VKTSKYRHCDVHYWRRIFPGKVTLVSRNKLTKPRENTHSHSLNITYLNTSKSQKFNVEVSQLVLVNCFKVGRALLCKSQFSTAPAEMPQNNLYTRLQCYAQTPSNTNTWTTNLTYRWNTLITEVLANIRVLTSLCFVIPNITVSQKTCAKLFLSELCQISTKFDNFWQKDGRKAKITWGALIFHLN